MNIISIGPAYPLRGGISRFNESLNSNLIKTGNQTKLVSFHYLYPRVLFPGKTQYTSSLPPEGLEICTLMNPLDPFTWIKAARQVIKAKPDVVVFHYWMPFFAPVYGIIARLIRRKLNVRMIAIAHNLIPHEKQPGSMMLTRFFLRALHGVVALSDSVLSDLDELVPGKKGIYLPHPVYDSFGVKVERHDALSALGLSGEFRYLLFFGLVRDYKGLDLLLDALKYVKAKKFKLLVAGEFYNNKAQYLEIIELNKLQDQVIIRDEYIPDPEVKYYFSVADLVVLPYKSATQSGVTQMAYHFDCPMLVTRVGGLPEIVPHGKAGYVVDPDPVKIAGAIDDFFLLESTDDMVAFIREEKKKYSWDRFTEKFLQFSKAL